MTSGLDDIVVADTILSEVDGIAGRLVIRGKSLNEIAGRLSFEDTAALLLSGFVNDLPDRQELVTAVADARRDVFERVEPLMANLSSLEPYDAMRAGVALMPDGDGTADALRLIAAPAVLTAILSRLHSGEPVIPPQAGLGQGPRGRPVPRQR